MSLAAEIEREWLRHHSLLIRGPEAARRIEWLRARIGASDERPIVEAPIGLARVEVNPDSRLWVSLPELLNDARQGPALILPVLDDVGTYIDLVAVHPENAGYYWRRYGVGQLLGASHLRWAITMGEPAIVYDTPLAMLRAYAAQWTAYVAAKRQALADYRALAGTADPAWAYDADSPDALPVHAPLAKIRQKFLARLAELKPPDWEDFGCCLLSPEADTEQLFGRAEKLVVDNPAFGAELAKSMKLARNRRRAKEQPLPPVVARSADARGGRMLTGIDPPGGDGAEDQAAE